MMQSCTAALVLLLPRQVTRQAQTLCPGRRGVNGIDVMNE
jgi:hypothetical protein